MRENQEILEALKRSKKGNANLNALKQRAERSFAHWSKLTGLPVSSLHRLEQCEQSITLGRLHGVMKKLKVTLRDIFGE